MVNFGPLPTILNPEQIVGKTMIAISHSLSSSLKLPILTQEHYK